MSIQISLLKVCFEKLIFFFKCVISKGGFSYFSLGGAKNSGGVVVMTCAGVDPGFLITGLLGSPN